jgi:hypothetical protein
MTASPLTDIKARQVICPTTGKSVTRVSGVSSPVRKNISLNPSGKSLLQLRPSRPKEGRWPSSRTLGGMRWTRMARLTSAHTSRTAKSCGPDAPTLASSWRQCFRIALAMVTTSPITGESTKETVKTIRAGNAGCFGEARGDYARVLSIFAREASVTGLDESIPILRDPLAGDVLLSGIGTRPSPDGVRGG